MNDERKGRSRPSEDRKSAAQSDQPSVPPGEWVASGGQPGGEPFPRVRPITTAVVAALVVEFGPEAVGVLPELLLLYLVGHAVARGARVYREISALLAGWAVPGGPAYDLPHSPAALNRLRVVLEKFFAPVYGKQFRLFRSRGEGRGSDGLTADTERLWRRLDAVLGGRE